MKQWSTPGVDLGDLVTRLCGGRWQVYDDDRGGGWLGDIFFGRTLLLLSGRHEPD